MKLKSILCALALTTAASASAIDELGNINPILPDFHADPEVVYSHVTGKYYIYSTTDGFPGWGGTYYMCFSSSDLINWEDEGIVLDLATDQVEWANGSCWAPAIEEKLVGDTYKYFLYFSGQPKAGGGKAIGVAVADSPTGPFVDSGAPIVSKTPSGASGQQIDVDVFTDPASGKSYLYWGNGYMAGAELNDDMMSIKESTIKVMTPKGGSLKDYAYREAPYVFYRNGVYYVMWSVDDTGSSNYHIAYGTMTEPLGNITVAADPVVLIGNPLEQIYGTGHNSVLQVPDTDEWYIVYHRINKDYVSNAPGIHRETCIDKMEFNEDGTIKPVTPTRIFPERTLFAPEGPIFLIQRESGLHLEKSSPTNNQALLRAAGKSEFGADQTVRFVPSSHYYHIVCGEEGEEYYLKQEGNNGWTTLWVTEEVDVAAAHWDLKDLGDGYYHIMNIKTQGALGTDEHVSGCWVYADKHGDVPYYQFYFSNDPTATEPGAGVKSIEADANAPVEYYNLQGVRVANPAYGLYIKRQGNKAEKVLF